MRERAVLRVSVASGEDQPCPLVRIDHVGKRFTTPSGAIAALEDVSLEIAANAFFTLLGPSGCGKTTLLRLLAGFEHPDAGTILLDGKHVVGAPPHRRPVNIVFQSYALFPHMSVAQNIAFGLERLAWPRAQITARVAAMLDLVRLAEMADRKPAQLSGGQQQRVALARALAPSPKLLLLDEPLSALDRKLRGGMQVELKRIQRETGITFLLVTHDQEEALSMSDRIAVMRDGRIEQIGTPREIYEAPRSRFVADFLGANVVAGSLLGLPAPFYAIRPEQVSLTSDDEGIPGRITETTYTGATTTLLVALQDGPVIRIETTAAHLPSAGRDVHCLFPPDALTPLDT